MQLAIVMNLLMVAQNNENTLFIVFVCLILNHLCVIVGIHLYDHEIVSINLKKIVIFVKDYQCYSSDGFQTLSSTMYSFKTQNPANDWNARLLIYGDLGLENGQSIPRIKKEIDDNNVDNV